MGKIPPVVFKLVDHSGIEGPCFGLGLAKSTSAF